MDMFQFCLALSIISIIFISDIFDVSNSEVVTTKNVTFLEIKNKLLRTFLFSMSLLNNLIFP